MVAEKPKTKAKTQRQQKTERRFTPQQLEFGLRYYLPTSPTFGNAYQSALAAEYSEYYAKNITTRGLEWMEKLLCEIVRNPDEIPYDTESLCKTARGVMSESMEKGDPRLRQDSAKFLLQHGDPEFNGKKIDITSGGEKIGTPPMLLVRFVDGNGDTVIPHGFSE